MSAVDTAPREGEMPPVFGGQGTGAPVSVISVQELAEDVAVLRLHGLFDVSTCEALKTETTTVIEQGHRHVIVDLRDVKFIDSCGLGVMFSALKRTYDVGGSLTLVGPQPYVQRVLAVTRLDTVLSIFADEAEALAAIRDGTVGENRSQ